MIVLAELKPSLDDVIQRHARNTEETSYAKLESRKRK